MARSPVLMLLTHLALSLCTSDQATERFRKFSTKTTYENSVAQDERYHNVSSTQTEWSENGCKPVLVVGLFRHGIRYPGEKDITNIAKVVFKMKVAGVSAFKVDLFEASANLFLMDKAKDLAATGKKEHYDLGKRFGMRVKEISSSESALSDFGFYSSSKSRATASCENFKDGLSEAVGLSSHPGISVDDQLLRFFDECSKYVVSVADNKSALFEGRKFQKSILPEINARIAEKLEVRHMDLTADEVKSLLVIAGSEIAIFGSSTWSKLLSDEDLELLEYASDIKNFWKKGYGYPINYEPSCVLLRHMFQHLENFVTCRKKKKVPTATLR